jgi:hypothetical protein
MKKEEDVLSTTKHLSWKILKPKCDNKNYKRCQIRKHESEMRLKIKWIIVPTLFI